MKNVEIVKNAELADILNGHPEVATKKWRLEEEVPLGKNTYDKPTSMITDYLAKKLKVKNVIKAPDGFTLIGVRSGAWRRPLVVMDTAKRKFLTSEKGFASHFN